MYIRWRHRFRWLQWLVVLLTPTLPCGFACSLARDASRGRLVPIELPTRRRRVFRIVAMTGSVAVCLVLRAVVLVWVAGKAIYVNNTVSKSCMIQ